MELFRKSSFHCALPVFILLVCLFIILSNYVVFAFNYDVFTCFQSSKDANITSNYRTGYHFQPPKNWMNAPMYYNGVYHLFYQYNPKGSTMNNIVWAHSVSKDLINWINLEPAIYPSKPFDKYGTWSGSATILPGNKPIILYTGVVDANMTQVQNYAVPANLSDPYLREWNKPDNNPLIVPDISITKTQFRDPTTAWMGKDGHWRIVVGSSRNRGGLAILYRSRNFMKWIKAEHPLHSSAKTGNWECPDFFPVSLQGSNGLDASYNGKYVKYVLKNSLPVAAFEYYTIGTYDAKQDRYIPDNTSVDGWKGLRLDYGIFYASKSFYDPSKDRRIVWGWSYELDGLPNNENNKGWAGIQAIPRKVWLDFSGKQLVQWPIEELKTLRKQNVRLSNKRLDNGEKIEVKGITASQADVEVTFSFSSLDKAEPFDPSWADLYAQDVCAIKGSTVPGGLGPFGLATLASQNLEEYTPVFFRVFKAQENFKVLMCSDATRSTTQHYNAMCKPSFAGYVDVDLVDKKLSLRSLIDNSVVESFGAGGKLCITSRAYPTLAIHDKAHLFAFNNGTEMITIETLDAWSMDTPKIN
ncbi:beta-fructofuranosidase, insoluble isoenzyme 1-like isoform X1 [Nicotiana tomentosiformis]|uniref:beta-fructofuranosidase, insoluble isoenzyme 1-like isoform X1 n=1 Tax=Nicotiana tomentosiformis TaxID=4098 RepID=UPI00051AE4CB|nr:beta-fructofuranosidase, insoluble isoenzyme 1-like isoform X2 [Nicotiana tomentosiformis]